MWCSAASVKKKNLLPLKALLQVSIVHHHVAMNHLGHAGSDVEPISLLWTSCQTAAVLDGWSEKPIFHSTKIINPNCNAAFPQMVGRIFLSEHDFTLVLFNMMPSSSFCRISPWQQEYWCFQQ